MKTIGSFIGKIFIALALAVVSPLCLAKIVLKLGHTGAPNHHYNLTAEKFKQAVEQRSNGEIEIRIFPADQLGNQRQLVEGAQLGTVDMVLTSDAQLSAFIDTFGILNLPFLFRDVDHVAKAMDGEVGDYFTAEAAKKGLTVLGYWENGFRHISNSKRPINTPGDLKGIKLRTPNSAVSLETFKLLGAQPTPMNFGEIYSALQLGVVDGQENPIAHILTQKWYEVQKYFSLTGHQHNVEPLVMSKIIFDGLAPQYQKILLEEGKAAATVSRKMVTDMEAEQLKTLEKLITVNKVPSIQPFVDAVAPLYVSSKKKYGAAIIEKIQAIK